MSRLLLDDGASSREARLVSLRLASPSTHVFSRAIEKFVLADLVEEIPCSPSPCGSEESTLLPDHPGHKGLDDRNSELRTLPGLGVRSETSALGSSRLMEFLGLPIGLVLEWEIECARGRGDSLTLVAWNGQVRTAFVFAETLRPQVHDLIEWDD